MALCVVVLAPQKKSTMRIEWHIDSDDVRRVKAFFEAHKNAAFVKRRIQKNVKRKNIRVSRTDFWQTMVSCLLTTQQRSGPNTPVTRFIRTKPFPLSYSRCCSQRNVRQFVETQLGRFGGLWRWKEIANELTTNLSLLEDGLWSEVLPLSNQLRSARNAKAERRAAEFIDNSFKGFGPKQSRNLLQILGLTRYEIPIDSRITKWLNSFGFPVRLSAQALADRNYYNFVSDGFQTLCKRSRVYPCELDAAIFVSFDKEEWREDEIVW